ncbi:MAG: DNA starvation/stationary phase protection protein [bacterium]|nr:DNA starvation/stationary phase protection protein [bacterium]
MKPHIGIPQKKLDAVTCLLSELLANEVTLYTKTRKSHWNIAGESFMELHKLFESHYKNLEASIDQLAERIGKLGGHTIGTMQEFGKLATLKEHPAKYLKSKEMLSELLSDHETVIIQLRDSVTKCSDKHHDSGTADFLTGLMEEHETTAWTLRRYLN